MFIISENKDVDLSKYNDIFKTLLYDNLSYEELLDYLKSCIIFSINIEGKECGFFSTDDLGNGTIEVHAYIYPKYRRYSKDLLKRMSNILLQKYKKIITTVTSDYFYIVRFLKLLGFSEYMLLNNAIIKNNHFLNVHYLELNRGDTEWV